jgi:CheY-like chemotaxis protein
MEKIRTIIVDDDRWRGTACACCWDEIEIEMWPMRQRLRSDRRDCGACTGLAFLDVQMPEMDGFAVLAQVMQITCRSSFS